MTDRQGNQIKLYYSERNHYETAETILNDPDGFVASFVKKEDLASALLDVLERIGRMRQGLRVE